MSKPNNELVPTKRQEVHCDDLIDDPTQPLCLRRFLRYHRWPAYWQVRAAKMGVKEPTLYATVAAPDKRAEAHCRKYGNIKSGHRVRVVMASRFGDLGITLNLKASHGYSVRVDPTWLTDFSEQP